MTDRTHDTLVHRLAQILIKLNQGERLEPAALAIEFGVNLRTIQRDLHQRFAYLSLEKVDGGFRLDPAMLGRLSRRDIDKFAGLAGVRGLFPALSDEFLRDIFDASVQSALLVKGHQYEQLDHGDGRFRALERAIVGRHCVSFQFQKEAGRKLYGDIEPYKLLNQKGIWYLAAKDAGKLKTFSFSKISSLLVSDTRFEADPAVEKTLVDEEGIWMGDAKQEIVLKVDKAVAAYFERRKLIANQVIVKTLEDGGLIISAKVGHVNQVLPIVRYWIPHLQIISPDHLQADMEHELLSYLQRKLPGG